MDAPLKLAIVMACYDDFDGVYFTVQHLREQDAELLSDCELIVVDNHPGGRQGERTRNFLGNVHGDFKRATYVPYAERTGTAAPRDHAFRVADSIYVCCVDSHVLLQRGALKSLLDYYAANPTTQNMICGPVVHDDRVNLVGTHFTDVWRHGMWGIWGHDMRLDTMSPECKGEPIEIPAMGLGLFSCRKDVWDQIGGFNTEFSGFGGEEWYIHEKVRNAGGRVMCLPQLRWIHRFNDSAPYPHTTVQKVRNYVIGHRELGLPLDRIYHHFVDGINEDGSSWENQGDHVESGPDLRNPNVVTKTMWAAIVRTPMRTADEIEAELNPQVVGCGGCQQQISATATLDEMFDIAVKTPGDINEHCPTLRELAAQCERVTDFSMRHGWSTVALLAGGPRKLVSYAPVRFPEAMHLGRVGGDSFEYRPGTSLDVDIEETDLLFIDTRHTYGHLLAELERHRAKVRRWIVRHDTVVFGEVGEDGDLGLLPAIRQFITNHPEWVVYRHDRNNNGLIVLSRDDRDKRPLPSTVQQAWNYGKALAKFATSGGAKVSEATHRTRLDVCLLCPLLNDGRCSQCGCPIDEKALWATERCPHPMGDQWPP